MITPETMIAAIFYMHTSMFGLPSNVVNLNEVKCLADNIYHESSGQTITGQRAVAHVTLNRVKRSDYPNTICKTVWQKRCSKNGKRKGFALKGCTAQFTWTWDGKPDKIYLYNRKGVFNDKVYGKYLIAVSEAVTAIIGLSSDPTFGASHYYNPDICYQYSRKKLKIKSTKRQCHPKWASLPAYTRTTKIDDHIFIRMDLPRKKK